MTRAVLCGHRGVGKSTLLERLKFYWPDAGIKFFDLDLEIETTAKQTVNQIFTALGERGFRNLERQVFASLTSRHPSFVIAVGGGFAVDEIPADIHCYWIQRPSDRTGRIFLDRPRLDPDIDPLAEFADRRRARDPNLKSRADEICLLPEGLRKPDAIERQLFGPILPTDFSGGFLTVSPWHLEREPYLAKIAASGLELRTDWLSETQVTRALSFTQNPLISFRQPITIRDTERLRRLAPVDWALELGEPPGTAIDIISAHDYLPGESLDGFLQRLECYSAHHHLKAAPVVTSFAQLEILWRWCTRDPRRRSILPRSTDGRWTWFRQFLKGRQRINFWRDGEGSAIDQPNLYQWLATPHAPSRFAAVLGKPTALSRTPAEHRDYFARRGWPVFNVDIDRDEWDTAIRFLRELGLRAAAVTSPHKHSAFILSGLSPICTDGSANTLSFGEGLTEVNGINTDGEGFKALLAKIPPENRTFTVWGGGGTLGVIRSALPHAVTYSLRTGQPREDQPRQSDPDVVIWAAGPSDPEPTELSPRHLVVDLNYREDSRARLYAKRCGVAYLSGESMFLAQAKAQRAFFGQTLSGPV